MVAIILSASTACEGEAEAMREEPEGGKRWKPGRGTGKAVRAKSCSSISSLCVPENSELERLLNQVNKLNVIWKRLFLINQGSQKIK